MKQGIREILTDEDKWPQELIFIGRNMRIVQGNNQYLGSPVNRVKMMGEWASRSLFEDPQLPLSQRLQNRWRHIIFKTVMVASDVAFYVFKLRQWLGLGGGMEDEMEKRMKDVAQDFGIELQHDVFEGWASATATGLVEIYTTLYTTTYDEFPFYVTRICTIHIDRRR